MQITTGTMCHLDARMIAEAMKKMPLDDLDVLIIENVGNLVCPASYDLGEGMRVVLLSVTEGEDKPLKYPPMFHSADVALVTKSDLADAVDFNRDAALAAQPGRFEKMSPPLARKDYYLLFNPAYYQAHPSQVETLWNRIGELREQQAALESE